MTPMTKGGTKFGVQSVERVEWLAQRDLGAPVPSSAPTDDRTAAGHWRRYVRDAHPIRFPAPDGVEVIAVEAGDSVPFASAAALWMHMPAQTEATIAALPGKPGWRCYAIRGGDLLMAAATFSAEEISLIAIDAAPDDRRKAERSALLHRIIEDALASGSRLICARVDERGEDRGAAAGLLLAGFEKTYLCPDWVDAGLPAG